MSNKRAEYDKLKAIMDAAHIKVLSKCRVQSCGIIFTDSIKGHTFPEYKVFPNMFKKWVLNCNNITLKSFAKRKPGVVSRNIRFAVCLKHFSPEDYQPNKKVLLNTAIPTLNLCKALMEKKLLKSPTKLVTPKISTTINIEHDYSMPSLVKIAKADEIVNKSINTDALSDINTPITPSMNQQIENNLTFDNMVKLLSGKSEETAQASTSTTKVKAAVISIKSPTTSATNANKHNVYAGKINKNKVEAQVDNSLKEPVVLKRLLLAGNQGKNPNYKRLCKIGKPEDKSIQKAQELKQKLVDDVIIIEDVVDPLLINDNQQENLDKVPEDIEKTTSETNDPKIVIFGLKRNLVKNRKITYKTLSAIKAVDKPDKVAPDPFKAKYLLLKQASEVLIAELPASKERKMRELFAYIDTMDP